MDDEGGSSQPHIPGVGDSVTEACPRRKRTHSLESNVHSNTEFTEITGKKSKLAHLKLQFSIFSENSQCTTQSKRKTSKLSPSQLISEEYEQLCVFCAETGCLKLKNTIKCE